VSRINLKKDSPANHANSMVAAIRAANRLKILTTLITGESTSASTALRDFKTGQASICFQLAEHFYSTLGLKNYISRFFHYDNNYGPGPAGTPSRAQARLPEGSGSTPKNRKRCCSVTCGQLGGAGVSPANVL